MVTGQDSFHSMTPACVYICPSITSVEEKHSQQMSFKFSFLYCFTWKETELVLLRLTSDIK